MPFIVTSFNEDDNDIQGVLGLARASADQPTYINLLQRQGVVKNRIVSFNYEDHEDMTTMS